MRQTLMLAGLMAALASANAAEIVQEKPLFDFGGDIRLRYDGTDNLPNEKHGEKEASDYMRARFRLWGKVQSERIEACLRIADEFRYYRNNADKGKQRFPDVLFIDNLYVTFKDLLPGLDAKVGRQDMAFGAKRIISDGNGGDGSRSTNFDALRLTYHIDQKRTLDAFGIYQARTDWLPTAGKTHDAKAKHTKAYDYDTTGYNQNEYGIGLYYTDKSQASLPWEAYAILKGEQGEHAKVLPAGRSNLLTSTFGVRLLPKFSDTLSGEAEVAAQFGQEGHAAAMAYGGLTYAPKEVAWSPALTLGCQYMSGDKAGYRGKNAWLPVFNRETGIGEAVAPMFNKYAYTNFFYPHLKLALKPAKGHSLTLQTGPMFAPVREDDGQGGTYGTFRGYYAAAKYAVKAEELFGTETLKGLSFALTGEMLAKGDYFKDDSDNAALFGRFEISYTF